MLKELVLANDYWVAMCQWSAGWAVNNMFAVVSLVSRKLLELPKNSFSQAQQSEFLVLPASKTQAQQHDIDGLQVREEAKVGEGGFSTIWCLGISWHQSCSDIFFFFTSAR